MNMHYRLTEVKHLFVIRVNYRRNTHCSQQGSNIQLYAAKLRETSALVLTVLFSVNCVAQIPALSGIHQYMQ